ncbi:MAG: DUF4129 domain-containing protein [Chloroflexi bacterium]|nr:DUF4129 domain-containing protein [Chloroflexota bacterium]
MRRSLPRLRGLDAGYAVPILGALVEALWAYPWFAWIASWDALGWPRAPLSLASAVVLVVAAEALSRAALARDWSLARVRLVLLPTLSGLLALAVRLELGTGHALWDVRWTGYVAEHATMLAGGLSFGAYLLWRGMSVGREAPAFDTLYRRFMVGLAGVVALLLVSAATAPTGQFRSVVAVSGPYVALYFIVGLLALALANFQSIRAGLAQQAEASELFTRQWLSLAVGAILGIVALAIAIAGAFSFDLLALLLHPLSVAADRLLTAFIYLVAYPLGVLAAALIYAWRALTRLLGLGHDVSPERFTPPDLEELRQVAEGQAPSAIPPWVFPALKWGLLALIVALVVLALARVLLRYSRGRWDEDVEEVHESLGAWDAFKHDLASLLTRLWRRFKRQRAGAAPAAVVPEAAADPEGQGRLFAAREIYQALLWEGRQAGLARGPWETPHEYRERLRGLMASGAEGLDAITEAYSAERYGDMAAEGQQLEHINRLWRGLRSALRGVRLA